MCCMRKEECLYRFIRLKKDKKLEGESSTVMQIKERKEKSVRTREKERESE